MKKREKTISRSYIIYFDFKEIKSIVDLICFFSVSCLLCL